MLSRRAFNKLLCMAFPSIWLPWPKALNGLAHAMGVDSTPSSLGPVDYFKTGMNMVLVDHGIYVTKMESVISEMHFAYLIRGLAVELKHIRHKKAYIEASVGHRAKYFSFMIDHDAMYHVEVRQAQLKEAINGILKAFGRKYL